MTILPGNDLPNNPDNMLEIWRETKSSPTSLPDDVSSDPFDIPDSSIDIGGVSACSILNTIKNTIRQVLSSDEVESDAKSPFPVGSDSSGIYQNMNVPDPEKDNPISKSQESTSSVMGYGKELANDLKAWQEDLGDIGREEINVLLQTYSKSAKVAVKPFKKELENSIKTTSSAAVALRNDYDEGNTHIKNNNIRQVNANQYRVGCDSVHSIKSPVIITGSKQNIHESEQTYIINDVSHTTTKHFWLRSEWSENYMSLKRTSYIIDENIIYSANESNYSGMRRMYSDECIHEVGQSTFSNLHPQRSRPENYGKYTLKSVRDQEYSSKLGGIDVTAFSNITISSQVGLVLINSWSLGITDILDTAQDILSSPGTMEDPPKHEKQDFKAPSGPAVSRNGNTPESYNFEKGPSSGLYKTSLGPQGGSALKRAKEFEGNNEES